LYESVHKGKWKLYSNSATEAARERHCHVATDLATALAWAQDPRALKRSGDVRSGG
jgi:hypothetical protein